MDKDYQQETLQLVPEQPRHTQHDLEKQKQIVHDLIDKDEAAFRSWDVNDDIVKELARQDAEGMDSDPMEPEKRPRRRDEHGYL